MKTKICSKCLRDLPIINFRKRRKGYYSYFSSWCRSCERVTSLKYYRLNKGHRKEYAAKYYKLNKEHKKNYRAEYYRLNKNRITEYYKLNRETLYLKQRLDLEHNPWKNTRHSILARVRGEYKKRNIKNYLNTQDLKFLYFRDKAFLMKRPTIHRIDNSGDYTLENCKYMESKKHIILHNHSRKGQKRANRRQGNKTEMPSENLPIYRSV